jgi:hypothetical protein
MKHLRGAVTTIAILVLLAMAAGPATAGQRWVAAPSQALTSTYKAAPPACVDRAYSLLGGRWNGPLEWRFQSSSTPAGLDSAATLTVIKRSFNNITGARNDCGLADTVSATSTYLGTTSSAPSLTRRGRCAPKDGHNVIGFGPLPFGILAVTCVRSNKAGRMAEADIRINSKVSWALTVASCKWFQDLLEPTMTHEIGHAFGLGHVSERRHGRLTMSTYSDGPCSNAETTLGRGDVRGLHHLYPL